MYVDLSHAHMICTCCIVRMVDILQFKFGRCNRLTVHGTTLDELARQAGQHSKSTAVATADGTSASTLTDETHDG